jgi:hypothetical protein
MVFSTARYWLNQPDEVLLFHLASELDLNIGSPSSAGMADLDATDVLPRIEPDLGDFLPRPMHRSVAQ